MVDELKIAGWGPPPADLSLGGDEVHVWRGTVRASASEIEAIRSALSRAERRELDRHPSPKNFAAARDMARSLLAAYLEAPPGQIRLAEGEDGRLALEDSTQSAPHWDFGWAENRAVFVISATRRLGMHLQAVPRDLDVSGLMSEIPPREASLVEFYSPQNRARAVAGYYAEREAQRRLARSLGVTADELEGRVERLRLGKRFVAALAADGWDWMPSFWQYGGRPEGPEQEDA